MGPKGVLLLSGGIDSPVAGHVLIREGCDLVGLHCSLEPFTDDAPEAKARRLAAHLGLSTLCIARIGDPLAALARACDHRHYFVLSKRLMLRLAEAVARQEGATFLATGESLGQVSSQTLGNLRAIDGAVALPVVRPLIGWDKTEIVHRAQAIGTYEVSVGPEVCDVLGPSHPVTRARLDRVEAEEAKLDVAALLRTALAGVQRVELRTVGLPVGGN